MDRLTLRVPSHLIRRFDAAAASRGGRSRLLRRLMEEAALAALPEAVETSSARLSGKLGLRLTPADLTVLEAEAARAGMTRTQWTVALIRARLHHRPQLSRRDAVALIEVQRELRRIGVNVNQIARALNTAVMEGAVLDLEVAQLAAFSEEIRAHLVGVRDAFQGNLAYWSEALRPPVRTRRARLTQAVLGAGAAGEARAARARLQRMVRRAPEVMVKITGRTRDGGHLQRHLDYITRNGKLFLEGPDGESLSGRAEVRTLAEDWRDELLVAPQRRDAPVSLSIVLSMPAGTDEGRVHDAARAFAANLFADRHPYVFALHTDDRHPHVHLTVRALGRDGERLNPRKADLQLWRETFAAALRDRGVEAEATPRRARGVVRKAERTPVRKLRERFERGDGPLPKTLAGALESAARPPSSEPVWEARLRQRQSAIRRRLVVEALRLQASKADGDRRLGQDLERFIRTLPPILTQREILARALAGDRGGADRRRDQIRER
ncbi:hypothetical protein LTR94_022686 [Friedmanniomyces endolithicus]|nr:hypothetical protein LTR94_022686 [Friedmanniomyces endolithicus]